jgi:hypothetical protein
VTQTEATTAVLARAAELEGTDWSGAIDLLRAANREHRRDELELALAGLRHRAGLRLAAEATLAPPPEPGVAPAIGASGLPEIGLADLSAPTLRAAILEHGCLLVPGAVDERRGKALADSIDAAFGARAARSGGAAPGAPDPWYAPLPLGRAEAESLGRKFTMATSGLLLCDTPRMMFEVLELYTDLGLARLATELLGGRPVLSANKCTVRRVTLDTTGGWHQDGKFLGADLRALNIWLALTPCGVDAPGLDVVPRRFDSFVDAGTPGAHFDWAASDAIVRDRAGEAGVVRPQFEIGDMLLFDEMMLHRTGMSAAMSKERHAIETWCFAGAAYPSGHVPLAW